MPLAIRSLERDDWDEVARIYADGLSTGVASFEVDVPSWDEWDGRHLPFLRLAAEADGAVAGWAAVTPVSRRACYAGVGILLERRLA